MQLTCTSLEVPHSQWCRASCKTSISHGDNGDTTNETAKAINEGPLVAIDAAVSEFECRFAPLPFVLFAFEELGQRRLWRKRILLFSAHLPKKIIITEAESDSASTVPASTLSFLTLRLKPRPFRRCQLHK
jgi:hypothetical protein